VDGSRIDVASLRSVKLTGPPAGRGSRMPPAGGLLSDAEVALMRDWIAAGVLP